MFDPPLVVVLVIVSSETRDLGYDLWFQLFFWLGRGWINEIDVSVSLSVQNWLMCWFIAAVCRHLNISRIECDTVRIQIVLNITHNKPPACLCVSFFLCFVCIQQTPCRANTFGSAFTSQPDQSVSRIEQFCPLADWVVVFNLVGGDRR